MTYIAKQNDTLDMICFKHYETLKKEILSPFLMANSHLLNKQNLEAGDIVNLPQLKESKSQVVVKYLWD